MLLRRQGYSLVFGDLQRMYQCAPRFGGFEYGINISFRCSHIGIGKLLLILLYLLRTCLIGVGRSHDLLTEDNIGSTLRPHNCYLGSGPGKDKVGTQMARTHGNITTTVSFAKNNGNLGNRSLAIGVQNLGSVTDYSAILLINSGQIAGKVYEGYLRNRKRIAITDKTGNLVGRIYIKHTRHHQRLIAHKTYRVSVDAAKPDHGIGSKMLLNLKEI